MGFPNLSRWIHDGMPVPVAHEWTPEEQAKLEEWVRVHRARAMEELFAYQPQVERRRRRWWPW
jgi:hypothetical protein